MNELEKRFNDTNRKAYALRCTYRNTAFLYCVFLDIFWICWKKSQEQFFCIFFSRRTILLTISSGFGFSIFPKFTFSSLSRGCSYEKNKKSSRLGEEVIPTRFRHNANFHQQKSSIHMG